MLSFFESVLAKLWAYFGCATIRGDTEESQQGSGDKPHVQVQQAFFHLECTNNVVSKSTFRVLSLSMLQELFQDAYKDGRRHDPNLNSPVLNWSI